MEFFREVTPLRSQDICVVLDSVNNGFNYPIHNHPEYELNLIIGTNGTRIVGDSIERFKHTDLVLLGPYLAHKWEDDQKCRDAELKYRVITVQFDLNLFSMNIFSKESFHRIKAMLDHSSRGIHYGKKTFEGALPLMLKLTEKHDFQNVMRFLQLLNLLANAKDYTYLSSGDNTSRTFSSETNRIQKAYNYVMMNYKRANFKVKDAAKELNMSTSAFSHFFKKNAFRSFSNFLIDLRLSHACKLILSTDYSIAQIANSSGFNNVSNFNRLFKKYKDATPKNYRKQYNTNDFDWSSQRTPWQFIPDDKGKTEIVMPDTYSTKINHV